LGQQADALATLLVAVAESTTIKSLDLRNTSLGRECGPALGNLLSRNRSIQHLDLRWNNLSNQGAQDLMIGLQVNPTIRTIELSGNNLSAEYLSAAGACSAQCSTAFASAPLSLQL
jgi:Ran GTPase-activating protein (RanGAP) involved in mRNA processing and transport